MSQAPGGANSSCLVFLAEAAITTLLVVKAQLGVDPGPTTPRAARDKGAGGQSLACAPATKCMGRATMSLSWRMSSALSPAKRRGSQSRAEACASATIADQRADGYRNGRRRR